MFSFLINWSDFRQQLIQSAWKVENVEKNALGTVILNQVFSFSWLEAILVLENAVIQIM